jgi:hypothetical protein
VSSQQTVALRFLRDACAYAMSGDPAHGPVPGPDEAAEIITAACRAALECGLELPGLVPPQASPSAAVLGAAGGEPDPARPGMPHQGGPARPRRWPALLRAGHLLHHP